MFKVFLPVFNSKCFLVECEFPKLELDNSCKFIATCTAKIKYERKCSLEARTEPVIQTYESSEIENVRICGDRFLFERKYDKPKIMIPKLKGTIINL